MRSVRFRKWRLLLLAAPELKELDYFITRLRDPEYPTIPCDDASCGYTQCEFVKFLKEES